MSAIRKAGVEFYPGITVGAALTGLSATLTAKYKLRSASTYTVVPSSFTEDIPGTYSVPVTLPTAGDYQFVIESSNAGIDNLSGSILVTNVNIDDVKTAIEAAQLDITSIKTQIDVLDEASLNTIASSLATAQATINNLVTLIDDANGDTSGLNSIMDYVTEINTALAAGNTSLGVLSTYTDNLELMLEGKAYTDTTGTPVLVADSHGLVEIFNLIESVNGDTSVLSTLLSDMSTVITDTVNNAHADIVTRLTGLNTVVNSNAGYLENAGYGLPALKAALTALQLTVSSHDTDKTDILAVLNNTTNGLIAIKTTIMDKLDSMDGKLDNIIVTNRSKIIL